MTDPPAQPAAAARDGPAQGAMVSLSAAHLQQVCDFVYRRTGMAYGEAKRFYIERRVSERMALAGAASFHDYMILLQSDAGRAGGEAEKLINSFTVNETYFYREEHQLRCLSRSLLPDIAARRRPGDIIRLWSVPCATGEESYSLAIWLLENWALVDAYHVEIIGSDIDTRVLEAAVAGEYGERALSRLPADVTARYFQRLGPDRWRIIQDLRESVRYAPVNLVDRESMAAYGVFDVIFCRNVLIYFDDKSRRIAAENLFRATNDGGYICLGHTESMGRISPLFRARRFADATVFQRVAGAGAAA
jgi:chemotaxis protein methyltransferase CheR